MSEVIVTVKFGEDKRIDLALPFESPAGVVAQDVAQALGLAHAGGQMFQFSHRQGKDLVKIAPTETLSDARVMYGDLLLLTQSGTTGTTAGAGPRTDAYVQFENGDVFLLNATATRIGRWAPGVELDVNLTQADLKKLVSRRHAVIEHRRGQYYLLDERSGNGTQLNGRKIPPLEPQQLSNGDVIQFGGAQGPRVTFVVKS